MTLKRAALWLTKLIATPVGRSENLSYRKALIRGRREH
jgi:hypothetical protein